MSTPVKALPYLEKLFRIKAIAVYGEGFTADWLWVLHCTECKTNETRPTWTKVAQTAESHWRFFHKNGSAVNRALQHLNNEKPI